MNVLPKSNEVNVEWFISSLKNMTASYKILCLKAICDEIALDNYIISYRKIISRMIAYSFKPLKKYDIDLGKQDQLNKIVTELNYELDLDKDNILFCLEKNIEEKKVEELSKYVIPLIIRPRFKDDISKFDTENRKYAEIEKLSKDNEVCLYRINKEKRNIMINNNWFKYIKYNKSVIDYWIKTRLKEYINSRNNIINIDEIVEEFFN